MKAWLERYGSPYPIRCRGSFHLYASRRLDDDAPRLVVIPSENAQREPARERLSRLARAHAAVRIEGVATVSEDGSREALPYVAFDLDVVDDGEGAVARLGAVGNKMVFSAGIAVVDRLAEALARAHEHVDPATGQPLAMGRLSWSNVLIARDGSIHWLGLGHNVVALTESDRASGAPSVYAAPEIANSLVPTASGDVYAFVMFQRSMLGYAVLPSEVDAAFEGSVDDGDQDGDQVNISQEVLRWVNHEVLAASPRRRASMATVLGEWRREWAGLGFSPDGAQLKWLVRELIGSDDAVVSTPDEAGDEITVAEDVSWIRTPAGNRFDLTRRRSLRGMVSELLAAHQQGGQCVSVDALLEAGWPGERPIREAGLNRVYVALSTLRKMDLKDVLQRTDSGYRFAPEVRVRVAGS